MLYLANLCWGGVCLSPITLPSRLFILVVFVLYGFPKAAMEPVQKTFVAELSPSAYRASSLGGFQMIIGLCALPASVIAGWLWETWGIFAPFYFSLGLTALSTFLLLFVKEA